MIGKLLRLFGYLFRCALCLFLAGISLVALLSGTGSFTLEMIPWWTGATLAKWLLAASLFGLLATALAASGRFPMLQLVWAAIVLGTLLYGFYYSSYKYEDWDHFRSSLNLTGAALVAFVGALTGLFVNHQQRRSSRA